MPFISFGEVQGSLVIIGINYLQKLQKILELSTSWSNAGYNSKTIKIIICDQILENQINGCICNKILILFQKHL